MKCDLRKSIWGRWHSAVMLLRYFYRCFANERWHRQSSAVNKIFFTELFQDVSRHVLSAYSGKLGRHSFSSKLQMAVEAIALCHNVTPTQENEQISYQAASPDEVSHFLVCENI